MSVGDYTSRRLESKIDPNGKRFLEYARTTSYPNYAVVGNTKPNLDFKANRMLQPIFATKMAIPQGPFAPVQPIKTSGLGGRRPIQIDYISKPLEKREPKGLLWEPNSIRELYGNVYPDGLPRNNIGAQAANSAYLDALNQEKKQKQLEERYNQRVRVNNPAGGRPHPDARMEEELKKLDEMLADTRYGKGPYKNIALNAEQHRKMAEKQAKEIKEELRQLREETTAMGEPEATEINDDTFEKLTRSEEDFKEYIGNLGLRISKTDENQRKLIALAAMQEHRRKMGEEFDISNIENQKLAAELVENVSKNTILKTSLMKNVEVKYAEFLTRPKSAPSSRRGASLSEFTGMGSLFGEEEKKQVPLQSRRSSTSSQGSGGSRRGSKSKPVVLITPKKSGSRKSSGVQFNPADLS